MFNKENERDVKIINRLIQLTLEGEIVWYPISYGIYPAYQVFYGEIPQDVYYLTFSEILVNEVKLKVKGGRVRDLYSDVHNSRVDRQKKHAEETKDGALGRLYE